MLAREHGRTGIKALDLAHHSARPALSPPRRRPTSDQGQHDNAGRSQPGQPGRETKERNKKDRKRARHRKRERGPTLAQPVLQEQEASPSSLGLKASDRGAAQPLTCLPHPEHHLSKAVNGSAQHRPGHARQIHWGLEIRSRKPEPAGGRGAERIAALAGWSPGEQHTAAAWLLGHGRAKSENGAGCRPLLARESWTEQGRAVLCVSCES